MLFETKLSKKLSKKYQKFSETLTKLEILFIVSLL